MFSEITLGDLYILVAALAMVCSFAQGYSAGRSL